MKKLILIFILSFSTFVYSSTSYAAWVEVAKSTTGDTFYIDFERIRQHSGNIFYWVLSDYLKPTQLGTVSAVTYYQGDCKLFRYKRLSSHFYEVPMASGQPESINNNPADNWSYANPNSASEIFLNMLCSQM